MSEQSLVPQALAALDPRMLDYGEWLSVGMAMKAEGMPFEEFVAWSAQNAERFKGEGDLMSHWRSFDTANSATPVGGGTIVELARRQGWAPEPRGHALGWDAAAAIVDPAWVEPAEIKACDEPPGRMLARYLDALFEADDVVGYVNESAARDDGRRVPANRGHWDRTAGQLIAELERHPDDLGAVVGDWDEGGGAWIRFNPLDGQGVRNDNVTDYRHALVECDEGEKDRQLAMIRALNLPCAAVVDSGGKSIHAIVRVDAANLAQYRERVDQLYEVCRKNGLPIDPQNKNPSRLSRMPGATRGGKVQALIETGTGPGSWAEWREWLEAETDDLPQAETLASVWGSLPALSEPLVHGILRRGHKMMLAGPSKAGKSLALMELAIAVAEGQQWVGFQCEQGGVLYVNLEIDRSSCLRRFADLYQACEIDPAHLDFLHVWSLRGRSCPMDRLAPMLIRRGRRVPGLALVVIDPIYKIITGDENSASDMAQFTAQFDRVADALGCAVCVCHHHSKGYQGAKRSMDRLSGSGVFARDPDALVDMSPLWLDKSAREAAHGRTGWRMSFTLREFADPGDVNLWFDYPRHYRDEEGVLDKAGVEGDPDTAAAKGGEIGAERLKEKTRQEREQRVELIRDAVAACWEDHVSPTRANVLRYIGEFKGKAVTEGQVREWTRDSADWSPFRLEKGSNIIFELGKDVPRQLSLE